MKNKSITFYLFTALLMLIGTACSKHFKSAITPDNLVIYPAPPDTARIQYLTSFSGSQEITGKRSAFASFILGEAKPENIAKPYGIFLKNSKIYICDPGIKGLEVVDLDKKSFDFFIPGGKGILQSPLNCFVDDNSNLFIADGERHQIVVFNQNGEYVNSFGEADKFKPTDVFVYGDKIFVPNMKGNQVNVYNRISNKLLYSFPDAESGDENYLYSPSNIFVTEDRVYISDFGDFRIKIFTHDGKFISSLGSFGRNIGQFVRPKGIAVDHENNLYVVDAGFENVQIFNEKNELLMFFGGPYTGHGDMWLPAQIAIDYDNLDYFKDFVDPSYKLKYIVLVTNQYGPDKVSIYGAVEPRK